MNKLIKKFLYLNITVVLVCLCSLPITLMASDHVDGPITIINPVADITDLFTFPSPDKEDHLVLILNSYPFLPANGHFSDRLVYSFVLNPVTISGRAKQSRFRTDGEEYRFDCTFEMPHDSNNFYVNCKTPSKDIIRAKVDHETGLEASGVRLFAGRRSDPFLLNTAWFGAVVYGNQIPPLSLASNDLDGINVLSIVLELDMHRVFKPQDHHLFAVAAEIRHMSDDQYDADSIIDRIGRPEITNSHLVANINQDDLRDSYNQQEFLELSAADRWLYKKRILENISYYDSLDASKDWQPGWRQALSNLLINDFLVIDTQKPFSPQSYFDIEYSMLRRQPHTRSGGRVPGDNIINTLMNTLISGGHGAVVADGIATHQGLPNKVFPYLAPASSGPEAEFKADLLRKAAADFLLLKRPE